VSFTNNCIAFPITQSFTFFNKIIDLKAGKKFSTDLERLDYVGDKVVDTSVKQSKKFRGAIKAIMSDDDTRSSDTIPEIPDVQTQINDIILQDGQALADMQLQLDNLQHKLLAALPELDLSNGDQSDDLDGELEGGHSTHS